MIERERDGGACTALFLRCRAHTVNVQAGRDARGNEAGGGGKVTGTLRDLLLDNSIDLYIVFSLVTCLCLPVDAIDKGHVLQM
jgi:hypothetical protein